MNINDMPNDPARHWEWIKYQLRIRGSSVAELARQLGITDRGMRAIKDHAYPRGERAIAKALGAKPVELWPERWNEDGNPKRLRPNRAESLISYHCTEHPKDSRYCPVAHRKTGTEA